MPDSVNDYQISTNRCAVRACIQTKLLSATLPPSKKEFTAH